MNGVDTNIPFYAHDSRDPRKQRIASELIATLPDGALVWQVACEYLWASRKLAPFGFSYSDAVEDIRSLRLVWSTILPDWTALDRMDALKSAYSLSFWDRLLIATCLEAGVDRLYSEDFSGYNKIESLEIVNPF
jgi:predicted nucleic acid-binding protein